jgi:LmbE family N-acetylglucosaminyl deacetylase
VHWVVFSAEGQRADEARRSATAILGNGPDSTIDTHKFRDGFFPYDGARVKDAFESLTTPRKPDVIFTHHERDRHQDHRVVSELTWNTFRDHVILEYEIPKYDGDLGSPNLFVPLPVDIVERKVDLLIEHFGTQRNKSWFTRETFLGLMRLRGIECRSPSGYAEAFYVRKFIWCEL